MKKTFVVLMVVAFLLGLAFSPSIISGAAPGIISYQGRVQTAAGVDLPGPTGQFKFALVNTNATTTFWSNDGTSTVGSEPTASVTLAVNKGIFSVLLGDTTIANMTQAIPASAFNNPDVRLRVWFNDGTNGFQRLSQDQRISSVGYALIAAAVDDGAITAAKIADGAVSSSKIAVLDKCRIFNAAGQNTPISGYNTLTFSNTRYDTNGLWTVANPTRITCKTNGVYRISGNVYLTGDGSSTKDLTIRLNGTTLIAQYRSAPVSNGNFFLHISTEYQLQAGDYVELLTQQSTACQVGGSDAVNQDLCEFEMSYLP